MADNLPEPSVLLADRGYDSDNIRKTMEVRDVVPVIPMRKMTCPGIFPPDAIRVRPNLRTDNEANEIHGRTDHRHPGRA